MNHHTPHSARRRVAATLAAVGAAAITTLGGLAAPATAADTSPADTSPADTGSTDSGSTDSGSTGSGSTGTSAESGAWTPEQIAPLVQPSVVYESISWTGYVYDRFNGQYLRGEPFTVNMQCTGFVVNPDGWVATAGHCVDPDEGRAALRQAAAEWALQNYYTMGSMLSVEDVITDYRVDMVEDGQVKRNQAERQVAVSWGASVSGIHVQKRKPARVVAYQEFDEGDGALLKVDETGLNAIELAETDDVQINTGVIAIGYPAIIDSFTDPDLTPTFDPGNVSSIKTVAGGLLSVFQLSAELSGGMSGGPTVDQEGRVVGVNSAHFVGEPFNYAVPAERIGELLASAGVENTVSEVTQTYREGIRAFFDGDRTTAVESLTDVLEEQPANGLAEEYLAKAKELPVPEPVVAESDGSTPWATIGGVAGAALLAAGAGALFLVRRRGSGGTASAPAPEPVPAPAPAPAEREHAQRVESEERVLVGATSAPAGFAPAAPRYDVSDATRSTATTLDAGHVETRLEETTGHATGRVSRGSTAAARYCTACGRGAGPDTAFCGACGARLG